MNYKKDLDEDISTFNQQRKRREEEELRKRHTVKKNPAKEDQDFDNLFPVVAGDGEW